MKKVLIFMLLISLSISFDVFSGVNSQIDLPDRLFLVSKDGVNKIKVTGKKENGYFPIDSVVVKSKNPNYFKTGDVTYRGWWTPDSQQFYGASWKIARQTRCSRWTESIWSFSYIPIKIKVNNHEVRVWVSGKNPPKNRQPKAICIGRKIYPDTCQYEGACTKWRETKLSTRYLVESKKDALILFGMLINGGKIIEQKPNKDKPLDESAKLVSASCRKSMGMVFMIVSVAKEKGWNGDPLNICDCFGERIVKNEPENVITEFHKSFDKYKGFSPEKQASYYKACMPI